MRHSGTLLVFVVVQIRTRKYFHLFNFIRFFHTFAEAVFQIFGHFCACVEGFGFWDLVSLSFNTNQNEIILFCRALRSWFSAQGKNYPKYSSQKRRIQEKTKNPYLWVKLFRKDKMQGKSKKLCKKVCTKKSKKCS